jgi:hypothetical protein
MHAHCSRKRRVLSARPTGAGVSAARALRPIAPAHAHTFAARASAARVPPSHDLRAHPATRVRFLEVSPMFGRQAHPVDACPSAPRPPRLAIEVTKPRGLYLVQGHAGRRGSGGAPPPPRGVLFRADRNFPPARCPHPCSRSRTDGPWRRWAFVLPDAPGSIKRTRDDAAEMIDCAPRARVGGRAADRSLRRSAACELRARSAIQATHACACPTRTPIVRACNGGEDINHMRSLADGTRGKAICAWGSWSGLPGSSGRLARRVLRCRLLRPSFPWARRLQVQAAVTQFGGSHCMGAARVGRFWAAVRTGSALRGGRLNGRPQIWNLFHHAT